MVIHSHVKEREVRRSSNAHFLVYIKTKLGYRTIETQKYFYFLRERDRAQALQLANASATHLLKRHQQLREARDNRVSLAKKFFYANGAIKGIYLSSRVRNGYQSIGIVAQKVVDGKQLNKFRSLPKLDPELVTFNQRFNEVFEWFSGACGVGVNNAHVRLFKAIVSAAIASKYLDVTKQKAN